MDFDLANASPTLEVKWIFEVKRILEVKWIAASHVRVTLFKSFVLFCKSRE